MARVPIIKLLRRLLVASIVLVVAAVAFVYGKSQWALSRARDVPLETFVSLPAHADSSEGRRLAVLLGCLKGCHGPAGEGGKAGGEGIFQATGPTLSVVLRDYSDAELARLVRLGVKRDGKSALGMPSRTFFALDDRDLALVIAYLRTLPPREPMPRIRRVEPLGRIALALGKWHVSADEVDRAMPRWGSSPRTTSFERGRYWASITCSECHGSDYRGIEFMGSPPLSIVAAYDLPRFERLLRTGEHLSGRKDGLMSEVARAAFFEFTDQEIADLHGFFLTSRSAIESAGRK